MIHKGRNIEMNALQIMNANKSLLLLLLLLLMGIHRETRNT